MIPDEKLEEFGFNKDQFPRKLIEQAVTLGLPLAGGHSAAPITIVIERGLMVPVQTPGTANGMIIREDGAILHVSPQNPSDLGSALKTTFLQDIPYDVRVDVYNIMKRAVEIDPDLSDIWAEIQARWIERYPPIVGEIHRQEYGSFVTINQAFGALQNLIQQFFQQASSKVSGAENIPLKVIVQTAEELEHGWQGEEFAADRQNLGESLKTILRNPVFHSKSTFRLCYEPRMVPAIKLVVAAPAHGAFANYAHGIEFNPF